ncbi:MAG: efflux transporter permease [Bryobacterales bacterium]|nr:efflux transporter permease [Bryobacterales bacterium]
MFWTFVSSAVRLRRRRLILAFSALAVAATLATTLFSVYSDIERKVSAEFSLYGANLVIAPAGSALTVPLYAVETARKRGAIAAPFLFARSRFRGQSVLLAGMDLAAAQPLTQYWHVEGARTGCLAGASLAEQFHLRVGEGAKIDGAPCRISGIVSTGGPEDNEFILPIGMVAAIAGVTDAASLIQVRVPADRVARMQRELRDALPGTDVRLVRAVAETESSVVVKIRVALFLLLALILAITTMSVSSNFSELVLERSREIGILKAIGAAERKIAALFVSESLILALLSTVAGYVAGLLLAGWIGASVFAAPFAVHLDLKVLLLATVLTLAVAFAATALAASRIWRIQPAAILRGD